MKATIYFIDGYTPLIIEGSSLADREMGSFTKIKDYDADDIRTVASIVTSRILYIEYSPDYPKINKDIKKEVQDNIKSSQ